MAVQEAIYPAVRVAFQSYCGASEGIAEAVRALLAAVHRAGAVPQGPPMALYAADTQDPGAVNARICVPVAEEFPATADLRTTMLPPAHVAVAQHVGSYQDIGRAYDALSTWVDDHRWLLAEGATEVYLVGPHDELPADQWRTEVTVRLKTQRPASMG